jgi:hypothetical protein
MRIRLIPTTTILTIIIIIIEEAVSSREMIRITMKVMNMDMRMRERVTTIMVRVLSGLSLRESVC